MEIPESEGRWGAWMREMLRRGEVLAWSELPSTGPIRAAGV